MTDTFDELYVHELELLLSAEAQMMELLPRLAKGTETAELREALEQREGSCREHRDTVRELLRASGKKGRVPLGIGMRGLIEECEVLLREFPTGNLRDAVMIAHMQRAEHYRLAAYATVREYAHLLGLKEAERELAEAHRAVVLGSKRLEQIGVQVDAEAYVDTRVERGSGA